MRWRCHFSQYRATWGIVWLSRSCNRNYKCKGLIVDTKASDQTKIGKFKNRRNKEERESLDRLFKAKDSRVSKFNQKIPTTIKIISYKWKGLWNISWRTRATTTNPQITMTTKPTWNIVRTELHYYSRIEIPSRG